MHFYFTETQADVKIKVKHQRHRQPAEPKQRAGAWVHLGSRSRLQVEQQEHSLSRVWWAGIRWQNCSLRHSSARASRDEHSHAIWLNYFTISIKTCLITATQHRQCCLIAELHTVRESGDRVWGEGAGCSVGEGRGKAMQFWHYT